MSDHCHRPPNPLRRKIVLSAPAVVTAATLAPSSLLLASEKEQKHQKLVDLIVKETGLDEAYVASAIAQAQFDKSIIERIKRPYESKTYAEYRPLFVRQSLADKGMEYIHQHQRIFDKALKDYDVQPQVISAILGMETRYGKNRGHDRVLDALFTLSTGYPKRATFFRKELGHFLQLCKEEKREPVSIEGSYAGAFGTTQFIPSSYRQYAVDADHDGRRDVWNSASDIINSVAHYFHRYGWDSSRPVAHWLDRLPYKPLVQKMLHSETRQWRTFGEIRGPLHLHLPEQWQDDDRVALIQRRTSRGKRTALVHYNFYVITRWNRSYNYAMAITELAHMIGCPLCQVES